MFNRIQGGVGGVKWIALVLHHTPTMKKWIKWRDSSSNSKSTQLSVLVTLVQIQSWQSWSMSFSELGDFWLITFFYQLRWCDDTGDNLKDITGNQAIRHQKSPILMNHLPEAAVRGGLTGTLLESRLFHSTSATVVLHCTVPSVQQYRASQHQRTLYMWVPNLGRLTCSTAVAHFYARNTSSDYNVALYPAPQIYGTADLVLLPL